MQMNMLRVAAPGAPQDFPYYGDSRDRVRTYSAQYTRHEIHQLTTVFGPFYDV